MKRCAPAVICTILAWFAGLFLDANINMTPMGFLSLRILLPILVMGAFILRGDGKSS